MNNSHTATNNLFKLTDVHMTILSSDGAAAQLTSV